MFCLKCGAPLADGAMFCEKCGAQQALQQMQPQQPAYQQPNYQQPAYQQPAYQQPAYQQPAYQQPAYQQPAYQQPAYQQPAYQQPAYQQPAYQQPAYQQPAYQQPNYQQPAYQQANYQQSAYQQPVYQEPVQQPSYQPQQAPAPKTGAVGSGTATAVKTAAKGGASALKWILIAAAVVSVIAVVIFVFDPLNFLKSDEDLIRERIQAFEDAYNNGDWEGILDCTDRGTRAVLNMTMSFAEGLLGEAAGMDISMSDMFAMSGMVLGGDYCQIEILDIQINGDQATVSVIMHMEMYEYSESEEFVLPMVKEGSDWYISGMTDIFG